MTESTIETESSIESDPSIETLQSAESVPARDESVDSAEPAEAASGAPGASSSGAPSKAAAVVADSTIAAPRPPRERTPRARPASSAGRRPDAATHESAIDQSVTEEAVIDESVTDESATDESTTDESATDETAADHTVIEEPSVDETDAPDLPEVEADAAGTLRAETPTTESGWKSTSARLRAIANDAAQAAAAARERRAEARSAAEQSAATVPALVSDAGSDSRVDVEGDRHTGTDDETHHDSSRVVLEIRGLEKRFGDTVAITGVDLEIRPGTIFGLVGPNGAGKTTTLSMITGLLRPDRGSISVDGADVWADPAAAKRSMGVLPDRLRLFDRLTGAQLLHYAGTLRGLKRATVSARSADLAQAFGLEEALPRLVSDYSAGMTKKIALASAMIHAPKILILDEPFETIDPVSAANIVEILQKYAAAGGTVVMSSHGMDLIERICDAVAIVVRGEMLASGPMNEVRGGLSLEERFIALAGGRKAAEGMEWLHNFSD
ncbi:ATP-binding cassette domain-containing protein [Marisediminicola sp. LYQ85]|uniref:ABC transporter ATP-binding protein n=1 Tax=Marisediminicola sp. LYQ85 TaxID=3391062 RepID=UPI003983BE0F